MLSGRLILFFSIFSGLFISCSREDIFFEQNKDIPAFKWYADKPVVFDFPVEDTISPYNFYINFRHTTGYEWKNIYFFVTTQFPDGKTIKDTVWCMLQDDTQWLGKGSGNLVDNTIGIKKKVRFPFKGNYKMEIGQAMRSNPLEEITDVGLKIVRAKAEK